MVAALKAGTTGKHALRAEVGDAIAVLQTKAYALDLQLNAAPIDFAASRQAQYNTFVAALPDVGDTPP